MAALPRRISSVPCAWLTGRVFDACWFAGHEKRSLHARQQAHGQERVWLLGAAQIPYQKTSMVLSYVTALVAEHASALYGNIHSGYYGELAKRFAAADKPCHHLNADCPAEGPCP